MGHRTIRTRALAGATHPVRVGARPGGRTARSSAWRALAAAAVLALGACGRSPRPAPDADLASAEPPGPAPQPDYAAPPRIVSVGTGRGGGALVSGRASPDARIRAVTTDQATYGATAGHDGRFILELPPVGRSRLVAISVEGARRSTRMTGWLFVPPDPPERALLLRAGAAAVPFAGAALLAAVDYDSGGGVALSGRTRPGAAVSVSVDGGPAQEARADETGDWALRLAAALPMGQHVLHVRSGDARVDRPVSIAARTVPGVFEAVREAGDWRVDWTPPGGGAQTTLVLLGTAS